MPSPSWQKRISSLLGWGSLALGSSAFCLLVFQALFGRQLEQLQTKKEHLVGRVRQWELKCQQ